MTDNEKLFSYSMYCGRMGSVDGIFVASQEQIDELIGSRVYFGEVLGKHSEIYGTVTEDEVTLITDEQVAVDVIKKHMGGGTGFNPLEYIWLPCGCMKDEEECEECEECED